MSRHDREPEFETIGYDELVRDDELSWLLKFPDVVEPVWLPKAECEIDEADMTIEVPDWLVVDRGIG